MIRKDVEGTVFNLRRQEVKVSLSIGVASLPEDTLEIESLIQKADSALYDAKKAGRNRVCCAQA